MTRLTSRQEIDDFVRGNNFLSANGGGEPAKELALLYDDLDRGLEIGWEPIDPDPDQLTATACFSFSIAPNVFDEPPEAAALAPGPRLARPLVDTIRTLESQLGREVSQLISTEIGSINTAAILDAAANTGKRLVDGDYAGRAIPELNATTPQVFGAPFFPWAFTDKYGNKVVITDSASNAFAERIGKYLAQGCLGMVGCALVPIPASRASEILVPGTLTESLMVGRAIREARESGSDPVAAAARSVDGWVLFRGDLTEREWEDTGYMEGFHVVTGSGEFEGHKLKLWFKNENHLSWLDGTPFAASPDLIEVVDGQTGEPLVNTYMEVGAHVAVVGRRRRAHFDSDAGLEALGPRHFGWDVDFKPIESLVG